MAFGLWGAIGRRALLLRERQYGADAEAKHRSENERRAESGDHRDFSSSLNLSALSLHCYLI
jgi:hypothetical protein